MKVAIWNINRLWQFDSFLCYNQPIDLYGKGFWRISFFISDFFFVLLESYGRADYYRSHSEDSGLPEQELQSERRGKAHLSVQHLVVKN